MFGFARRCVQDAGLPSRDTANLRQQINVIELNRDDKAHRFVVTSNAFQDGNKLAYLALAIAIAIDALVFMSGLFGANAVRSPLSDVPSHKGRSARQLEDVVQNALLPDKFENAMLRLTRSNPSAAWHRLSLVPVGHTRPLCRKAKSGHGCACSRCLMPAPRSALCDATRCPGALFHPWRVGRVSQSSRKERV